MNAEAVIADFKTAVSGLYGERLDKIILYGSRARGDYREDSDFDFAVVLKDKEVKRYSELKNLCDVVFPIQLAHSVCISYMAVNNTLLNQPGKVFYYFLRTEGKII